MSALQVMLAGKVGPRALAGSFFVSPADHRPLNRASATQRDSDLRTDVDTQRLMWCGELGSE